MNTVFISPDAWHYKVQEFVYGQVPYRYHFCPYFWLAIAAIIFFPIIFAFRAFTIIFNKELRLFKTMLNKTSKATYKVLSVPLDKIDIFLEKKNITSQRAVKLSAQEYFDKYITNNYEAFKFYFWNVDWGRKQDFPLLPKINDKQKLFFNSVWEVYKKSKLREDSPFSIEYSRFAPCSSFCNVIHNVETQNIWQEYIDRIQDEYETLYEAPYLEAKKQADEAKKIAEEIKKQRLKDQQEFFSKIATYTKYPVFFILGLLVIGLGGGICYGLYKLSLLTLMHWTHIVNLLLVSIPILIIVFASGVSIVSVIVGDREFRTWPVLFRLTALPFRFIVHTLIGSFIGSLILPFVESINKFTKAKVKPALIKAIDKIKNSLSIFATFITTIYEGACPTMAIEGDDPEGNYRVDFL